MTVVGDLSATARSGGENSSAGRRLFLFFLGPRVIDFDTFLPTAMQLRQDRREATIRFVTFSRENYDFIRANPALMEGLRRCGSLHLMGGGGVGGWLSRMAKRALSFVRIAGWIVARPLPVLLAARPFAEFPYNLFAGIARLRRGNVILLWKSRSPDKVHHVVWQNRAKPKMRRRSPLSALAGGDADAVVYYHQDQVENVQLSDRFGRIDGVPWRTIGFPHLFPAWRQLIADEIVTERRRLRAADVPEDAELYAMFAAKPWSSTNLRSPDAVERVFRQTITALCRLRPRAVVLIRPHPLAVDEPYIRDAIAAVGSDHARLCFAHPEVMLALSRRALFNNPTNIMFTCFRAAMIDCSDYADRHYQEHGKVSLAHGYGPLFIDPRAEDFEVQLKRALDDDALFADPELGRLRDDLLARNPANLDPLMSLLRPAAPAKQVA